MMTYVANLLIAMRNSNRMRCINTFFSPTMVETIDKRIPSFTSFSKGILFVFAFSMQCHLLRTVFCQFSSLFNTVRNTLLNNKGIDLIINKNK